MAIWIGGLPGPYQFDDYVTPLNDPASQSLSAWASHLSGTLRPLAKLTYAAEASLGWDETPALRRLISILMLACSAVLLQMLLVRLMPECSRWGALTLALVWALHPVHTENLLQVCGRPVILSNLLVLACLVAALERRGGLAAVLLILAGLARETALAAALTLWLIELSRKERNEVSGYRKWVPVLVASLFLLSWYGSTNRYWELADYSFLGRPLIPSISAQVGAVPHGLLLYLKPRALSLDYGIALPRSFHSTGFLTGLTIYGVALVALLIGIRRRLPALAVGAGLWLAAVLPTQSVIPKLDALTSRPLSLALAGLMIVSLALVEKIFPRRAFPRGLLLASTMVLALWLGASTLERQKLYASELLLWGDAAGKSIVNPRPHLYFALLLKDEGRLKEAALEIERAYRIDPFDSRIAAIRKKLEYIP